MHALSFTSKKNNLGHDLKPLCAVSFTVTIKYCRSLQLITLLVHEFRINKESLLI